MKRPGFMMVEVMLAMSIITFVAMITANVISTNLNYVQTLKTRYELLSELKNHLTLKLLNPAEKEQAELFFQHPNTIIKTKTADIEPKSSLKNYVHQLKLLNVTAHKDNNKETSINVMGLVIVSQQQEQK